MGQPALIVIIIIPPLSIHVTCSNTFFTKAIKEKSWNCLFKTHSKNLLSSKELNPDLNLGNKLNFIIHNSIIKFFDKKFNKQIKASKKNLMSVMETFLRKVEDTYIKVNVFENAKTSY